MELRLRRMLCRVIAKGGSSKSCILSETCDCRWFVAIVILSISVIRENETCQLLHLGNI